MKTFYPLVFKGTAGYEVVYDTTRALLMKQCHLVGTSEIYILCHGPCLIVEPFLVLLEMHAVPTLQEKREKSVSSPKRSGCEAVDEADILWLNIRVLSEHQCFCSQIVFINCILFCVFVSPPEFLLVDG